MLLFARTCVVLTSSFVSLISFAHFLSSRIRVFALEKGHDMRSKLASQLLTATMWMQDAGLKQGQGLIDRFKAVTQLQPQWDQGHFQLGRYYDYMLRDLEKKMHAARRVAAGASDSAVAVGNTLRQRKFLYTMLTSVLESYGHALMYGHTYLFEAMPRLLTLWFR